MSEWRPIETAPKDETEALGWNMSEIRVIWWHRDDYGNAGFICGFDDDDPDWFFPTHWMALPKPPTHNPEKEE